MDELSVVGNEAMEAAEVIKTPSVLKTIGPIAGGVVVGVGLGFALCKWVINPIIDKHRAKKAKEVKAEETPKSED